MFYNSGLRVRVTHISDWKIALSRRNSVDERTLLHRLILGYRLRVHRLTGLLNEIVRVLERVDRNELGKGLSLLLLFNRLFSFMAHALL